MNINKSKNIGKTRSEQEKILRSNGFGGTLTDEQLDKCKWLEKKHKEKTGSKHSFFNPIQIDKVK